ncbi:phosphoribosylformylglycinamidine synthase [Striga asiatica]|uniref:Phosphoribosylformylglycinamidine synthase n=1 Tax=Striga asiatica TaxID=4170 RepID=A0A5A7RB28_STRAF|nr:phosphoribosylformylglycinamidine synthase [Striga asiatica]
MELFISQMVVDVVEEGGEQRVEDMGSLEIMPISEEEQNMESNTEVMELKRTDLRRTWKRSSARTWRLMRNPSIGETDMAITGKKGWQAECEGSEMFKVHQRVKNT